MTRGGEIQQEAWLPSPSMLLCSWTPEAEGLARVFSRSHLHLNVYDALARDAELQTTQVNVAKQLPVPESWRITSLLCQLMQLDFFGYGRQRRSRLLNVHVAASVTVGGGRDDVLCGGLWIGCLRFQRVRVGRRLRQPHFYPAGKGEVRLHVQVWLTPGYDVMRLQRKKS